jgi:hypothetical protein
MVEPIDLVVVESGDDLQLPVVVEVADPTFSPYAP